MLYLSSELLDCLLLIMEILNNKHTISASLVYPSDNNGEETNSKFRELELELDPRLNRCEIKIGIHK